MLVVVPAHEASHPSTRGLIVRGAIVAADFFTTEVWTVRGLVTYYTAFVIDLESRRVHLVRSTPYPDDAFVGQVARVLTGADDGVLRGCRILIRDRDTKWSATFRRTLADAGIRVVQTPFQAPNCNAYAERFVRSIKEECLNRVSSSAKPTCAERSPRSRDTTTGSGITKVFTTG